MRTLLVTQDFPPLHGGIQTYMAEIAPILNQKCPFFAVIAPREPGSETWDAQQDYPIQRVNVHSSFLVLRLWPLLNRWIKKHRIERVLFAQWFPALALFKPKGVRVGIIAHGREYLNHPLGKFGLGLMKFALSKADYIFPNSHRTATLVPREFQHKITVCHPGVNTQQFKPAAMSEIEALRRKWEIPPDAQVLCVLTRLVPRKGVDSLIQVFAKIAARNPHLHLLIGGKGPDQERLESIAQQIPEQDRIRFLGRVEDGDLNAFYGLGLFCLLSREESKDIEGFGLVLAEAQACGAAVVCARSGGMPEAVIEDETALIVPPLDIEQSAERIAALLAHTEKIEAMKINGRQFAEQLSWERCVDQMIKVL